MAVLQGNVSGSISTIPINIPGNVVSFFLVPRSITEAICSIYIATDNGDRAVIPVNTTILSNARYAHDVPFIIQPNWYFIIVSNVSLDYYITIE